MHAGGSPFAADPALSAAEQPIFWRPEVHPRTIVLALAPAPTPQTIVFEPSRWGGHYVERSAHDGLHALLTCGPVQYRLWSPGPLPSGAPVACVIPFGGDVSQGAAAALQFWRHLMGAAVAQGCTLDERMRRAQRSLRALDGHASGASYREVAEQIFGESRVEQEAWKTSSIRDVTIRLVRSGMSLMRGDYVRLLGGRSPD